MKPPIKLENKFEEWILVALLGVMTLFVLLEMFGRYVKYIPIAGTLELTQYILIWFGWLSASYTLGKHAHIRVTFLVDKFGATTRRSIEILVFLCVLAISVILVVVGYGAVMKTAVMGQTTPSLQIPVWMIYVVIPLTGLSMSIRCVIHLISLVQGRDFRVSDDASNLAE